MNRFFSMQNYNAKKSAGFCNAKYYAVLKINVDSKFISCLKLVRFDEPLWWVSLHCNFASC